MKTSHSPARRRKKKKVLHSAKGYWGDRSKQYRRAVETVRRALAYAYRDRRVKKREFRSLWITRINAAARAEGLSYRELMHVLKKKNVLLSRDMLAKIAAEQPDAFQQLVQQVTQ
ncbi:MAG: 50S ribosomal protein L20 [Candidatus Omnitrophica bacterium]|nr:50S ribosomal protein L20 [Candidatus Omnitrophota bacterium]